MRFFNYHKKRYYQVYHCLDDSLNTLYIGRSLNPMKRLAEHRRGSEWYGKIKWVAIDTYSHQAEMEMAERRAIAEETPPFNRIKFTTDQQPDPVELSMRGAAL